MKANSGLQSGRLARNLATEGFLSALLWLLPAAAHAQAIEAWVQRCDGPGNALSYVAGLAVDGSGNVYVAVRWWANEVSLQYGWATLNYSSAGVPLRTNLYYGIRDSGLQGFATQASAIAVDATGNVYVIGSSVDPSQIPSGYQHCTTLKYSSAGVPVWTNVYPTSGSYGMALAVDASGDVVVVGMVRGLFSDYLTLKYSSAGALLWARQYNGPANGDDHASAVVLDTSGNVFVTGESAGSGTYGDYATIEYSSAGVPLWTNRYNGPANWVDQATAVAVDARGNVFVTGSSGNTTAYPFDYDYATVGYSRAGVPLWTNRNNGPPNGVDGARAIALDGSGNVFVTGNSRVDNNDDVVTIKYVIPPIVTHQPLGRTNAVGTMATFTVEVAGSAPFSYQWRKDGTNLVNGGRFSGVTTTNLLIPDVQLADAAAYTVVVTNAYGSVTSVVAQLTVTIPPSPGRFTNLSYSPDTGLSFIFRDAAVGQPYRIQRSSSMAEGSWLDWQSFNYNGPMGFMDVGATGGERRFYRAVTP